MRFGSLFVLLFLSIMWIPFEANGYSKELQNPCRDDDCFSHSSVHVNHLTVNIFPGLRNNISDLPPGLRQLLTGLTSMKDCNSTHQKQHLEGDVNRDVETTIKFDVVRDSPGPRDDRPVSTDADAGPDNFEYFLGTELFDSLQGCRAYCRRRPGFRLAIAKTKETLDQMRNYPIGMVDLAIIGHGANVELLWGDGTPLDYSIVLATSGEPLINQPGNSNKFVMWPLIGKRLLDDHPNGWLAPCLCQGNWE